VAAFVAHDDIEPTKEWEAEIERALRTTDALAAIITKDFVESKWCDQEVGYAVGRGKLAVPLCSETDPHGFLGKYQKLSIKGLVPDVVAARLFDALLSHPLTSQRMTDALVDRMANSGSFAISKSTMPLLEKVSRLNDSQVAKLIQAVDDNKQVRDALGIPPRVRELVTRVAKINASP
jgi:hypothetical protein